MTSEQIELQTATLKRDRARLALQTAIIRHERVKVQMLTFAIVVILGLAMLVFSSSAKAATTTESQSCVVLRAQLSSQVQKQLFLVEQGSKSPAIDWQAIDQYLSYGRRQIELLEKEQAQKGCLLK